MSRQWDAAPLPPSRGRDVASIVIVLVLCALLLVAAVSVVAR